SKIRTWIAQESAVIGGNLPVTINIGIAEATHFYVRLIYGGAVAGLLFCLFIGSSNFCIRIPESVNLISEKLPDRMSYSISHNGSTVETTPLLVKIIDPVGDPVNFIVIGSKGKRSIEFQIFSDIF